MKKIYNKSSQRMEEAKYRKCPRCSGMGGCFGDEDSCPLCAGHGNLWISTSGWTLKKYGRVAKDEQLY